MYTLKDIEKRTFELNLNSNSYEANFNTLALQAFHYQYSSNSIYRSYVSTLKLDVEKINHYTHIPFLPIQFFKSHKVTCNNNGKEQLIFLSSATTGEIRSKHYIHDVSLYEKSFLSTFKKFYGNPNEYCILALLPNYLEKGDSSLVYMFNRLVNESKHELSGFYLSNLDDLIKTIRVLIQSKQKTILLGVTYALLDLADKAISLNENFIVMETGGMKGKRKEMVKEELHNYLKSQLNVDAIHSEYGMTELLSQAYSKQNGIFECPPWMKISIREVNDPFSIVKLGKTGGLNIIDLANLHSCSFIETKDLARINKINTFEIIGRFDNSDIRGCNLMFS